MIIDRVQQFSDAQALSGAGNTASTDVLDLSEARRIFEGEPMIVVLHVDVAADAGDGDETYQFDVQTDDNSSFTSATTLASRAIARASLTAGSRHTIPIPMEAAVEQYLRLYYTLGGTTPSITVTAHLMPLSLVQKERIYPDNITIS